MECLLLLPPPTQLCQWLLMMQNFKTIYHIISSIYPSVINKNMLKELLWILKNDYIMTAKIPCFSASTNQNVRHFHLFINISLVTYLNNKQWITSGKITHNVWYYFHILLNFVSDSYWCKNKGCANIEYLLCVILENIIIWLRKSHDYCII